MPVNMAMLVVPRLEIPAQTWTLKGCFTFGLSFGASLNLRKHNFAWLSNQIDDSSVNMTLSKVSLVSLHFCANASLLMRLGSFTNWQYFTPDFTHPNFFLAFLIVVEDTFRLKREKTSFCICETFNKISHLVNKLFKATGIAKILTLLTRYINCISIPLDKFFLPTEVNSSFRSISASIKFSCSGPNFLLTGRFCCSKHPFLNERMYFATVNLVSMSSSAKIRTISQILCLLWMWLILCLA